MTAHVVTDRRSAIGSLRLVAAVALGAWACSSDSGTEDTAVSGSRPSAELPTQSGGSMNGAAANGLAMPVPSGTDARNEASPVANGGALEMPGSAGAQTPAGATPAPGMPDAGGAAVPPLACPRAQTDANKASVNAAINELFVQGDITAVDRYWGAPYLQHNPVAASGVETFRNLFSGLIRPGASIYALSRLLGECELVLIHGNYTSFGGPTFDLFRVDAGRIVEHWDAAALGAGPNASGHTALDGATQVEDVELVAQNQALVLEFVARVLVGGARDAILDYVSTGLIEHNPESQDGAAAYVAYLEGRAITYRQVHHDIADGNFVFVLSEGAVGTTQVAHYDLFRVDAGRIVEHWDGRRPVPATTASGLGIF